MQSSTLIGAFSPLSRTQSGTTTWNRSSGLCSRPPERSAHVTTNLVCTLQPVVHRVGDELASHLLQEARALVVDGGGAGVEEHGDGAALRLAHHVHQEQALPVGPAMVVVEARGPN